MKNLCPCGSTQKEMAYFLEMCSAFRCFHGNDRNDAICAMRLEGETYRAIGRRFGITQDRVRQIVLDGVRRGKAKSRFANKSRNIRDFALQGL